MTDNTQPNPGSDDTFSDAERAFFESGGKVSEGLFESPKAEPVKEPAPAVEKPAANGADKDEAEPGEVALDDSGRVRDAKTGRYVPLPVLRKERDEHKATRRERDELRDKWTRLEEKWKHTQEILAADDDEPAANGKAKAPAKSDNPWDESDVDPEKDVFAAFQQERRRNAWNRKQAEESSKSTNASLAADRAQRSYEKDVVRFKGTEAGATYDDAYKHLLSSRAQQLYYSSKAFRNSDGSANVDAIKKQIRDDEIAIRDAALNDGESPAERVFSIARAYGYAPKPAANGKEQEPKKTPAQETIERIEAGKSASLTLNGAGGAAKPGLTMAEYLDMDDAVVAKRLREDPAFKRQVEALHGKH